MTPPIRYDVADGLARVTLDRPERLNAIDPALAREWARVTSDAVSRADVRAVLIDASGPAFCAGGDVLAMAESPDGSQITSLAEVLNTGIMALVASAVPVVVAAHGTTAGGGLGLLLSSDYAVVGTDSLLTSRYAQVGLTPDLSVTAQLTRAVGERRALQLLLSDVTLTAQEALAWGLVAEIVEAEDPAGTAQAVRDRAHAIARGWVDGTAGAYGQAKRLVRAAAAQPMAEQLADEARTIGAAVDTADARTRIAAFVARAAGDEARRP